MRNGWIVLSFFGLVGGITGCAPEATLQELEQMCTHLAELRGEVQDKAKLDECVAEAKKEGTSQRQARCRISAVNKSEYWNRCRTGEARRE